MHKAKPKTATQIGDKTTAEKNAIPKAAHKIPPSVLTLQDDGTVGVKAINENNKVIFYPIKKEIDTIDGMWVSGLPESIELITSGQEYVSIGQIIN